MLRQQLQLQNRPLLVLANKQDLPNASHMSVRHVADHVQRCAAQPWRICPAAHRVQFGCAAAPQLLVNVTLNPREGEFQ